MQNAGITSRRQAKARNTVTVTVTVIRGAAACVDHVCVQVSAKAGPTGSHHVPELDRAWDALVLDVRLPWPLGLLLGREQVRRNLDPSILTHQLVPSYLYC